MRWSVRRGSRAAKVRRALANPFPGSATSPRPNLERGNSEKIHGLAVAHPRISAGSTVVSVGAASGGPIRELGQRERAARRFNRRPRSARESPGWSPVPPGQRAIGLEHERHGFLEVGSSLIECRTLVFAPGSSSTNPT